MSANAVSLRRILRSIGSNASPSSNTTGRNPPNLTSYSNTRAHSQNLAPSATCHHASHSRQQSNVTARTSDVQSPAEARSKHGNVPNQSAGAPKHDQHKSVQGPRADSKKQESKGSTKGPSQRNLVRKFVKDSRTNLFREVETTAKDQDGFSKHYFTRDKANENTRMKERARRSQLLKERHEYSDERAWQDILQFLEQASPHGTKEYTKRMETIRLPEGIYLKWEGDPGESVLEVMQRTGSHVQVIPSKEIGVFSSLTLLGRPAQNAAAKRLLQESELLQAVSEDGLRASKSISDYDLHSEISNRHGETLMDVEDGEGVDSPSSDLLDVIDEARLENAVIGATGNVPTRAVWSNASSVPEHSRIGKLDPSSLVSKAAETSKPMSAISLTARVEQLTAVVPKSAKRHNARQFNLADDYIRDELVALMTKKDHSASITPLAASKTLQYLAKHMYFPAVREVLNALRDVKLRLSADIFNPLLAAAAQSENVLAFHYMTSVMRDRAVSPNAGTWIEFHILMLKRFPAKADQVVKAMSEKSVQADLSGRIDSIETYSAVLLASFLKAFPGAPLEAFIDQMSRDHPGLRWLTTYSVNKVCHHLLRNGNMTMAYQAVDELVCRGGRPDAVTLNTFLSAAKKDGDIARAISILRKFHDLHAKSTPLAEATRKKYITMPRAHDLSIRLDYNVMQSLCSLAWERKNFNCLRVFWRYACCSGHVSTKIIRKMHYSMLFPPIENSSNESTNVTRTRLWGALAAKFAMGVKAGLDSSQAGKMFDVARGLRQASATGSIAPDGVNSVASTRRAATAKRGRTLKGDLGVVQSLRPTEPLVDLVEKALAKDKEWKDQRIGLPTGIETYGSIDAMFEAMLKEGVEVPMEVGNATGMKL